MLLITCPYCGDRPETEFHYGGEAHIARPENPASMDDEAWGEFLYLRGNQKGAYRERWNHSAGCRKWFNVLRNTHTHEIYAVYEIGADKPELPGEKPAVKLKSTKAPAKASAKTTKTPAKMAKTAKTPAKNKEAAR